MRKRKSPSTLATKNFEQKYSCCNAPEIGEAGFFLAKKPVELAGLHGSDCISALAAYLNILGRSVLFRLFLKNLSHQPTSPVSA